jgi:flagellin-like hook-associated protein FlgL
MRVSTFSAYNRVLAGLRSNQLATLRAQEELASQRRILRPSDDPAGTSRSLALRRALARTERVQNAIAEGTSMLELASTTLEHGSELLTRTRELLLQGMNGTLTPLDREALATELEEVRKQLLDAANLQVDGTFVFGGTRLGDSPFVEVSSGGSTHVVYAGNHDEQMIQTGEDARVAITVVGEGVFGSVVPGAVRFDGLTGVASGSTADEGRGYGKLILRHDATDLGSLGGAGIALVNGGAGDTLLGANALTIDATAGTIRLGNGQAISIPDAAARGDIVLENERGGVVHLDLSGWNGLDTSGALTGQGSISLDGTNFTTLDFTQPDLELSDTTLGRVVHVDTRGIQRAGVELVTFGETGNPFDLIQGIVEDLRNGQGLDSSELASRLSVRLEDLDRVHDDLLLGLGVVGARSARLASSSARQSDVELDLTARLSEIEDADLAEVASSLARSQMLLEVAQAASARVLQTSLLNFLG